MCQPLAAYKGTIVIGLNYNQSRDQCNVINAATNTIHVSYMHKHCIVLVSQYHLFCNCGIALAGQYNTLVSYWPSQYTHFKIRVLYRWANPPDTSPIHQVLVWYWRANTQISDFVYHIGPTNTGPWQAPIYVSNKKSWILPKFMHFSSLFIHVS
jgi:hypothetical protein